MERLYRVLCTNRYTVDITAKNALEALQKAKENFYYFGGDDFYVEVVATGEKLWYKYENKVFTFVKSVWPSLDDKSKKLYNGTHEL